MFSMAGEERIASSFLRWPDCWSEGGEFRRDRAGRKNPTQTRGRVAGVRSGSLRALRSRPISLEWGRRPWINSSWQRTLVAGCSSPACRGQVVERSLFRNPLARDGGSVGRDIPAVETKASVTGENRIYPHFATASFFELRRVFGLGGLRRGQAMRPDLGPSATKLERRWQPG